jgi:hypothetical protein
MGGRCQICGYNQDCPAAFDFHHRDPEEKLFSIGAAGLLGRWEDLLRELAKCVLLCCRCHAEVHSGLHRQLEEQRKGQVAQLVERGPEKADVAGSSPALSTQKG